MRTSPIVLSIAGFDPSSGAGITADIKTIAAHGCYGIGCVTALTVQSTRGVRRSETVPGGLVRETIRELQTDLPPVAVKIGMLGNAEVAGAVADYLLQSSPPIVVLDPIMRSSSGTSLIDEEGLEVLMNHLLPLAHVVTPNLEEAAAMAGMEVSSPDGMSMAAQRLHQLGARTVLIKGGHLDGPQAIDLLSISDEGGEKHQEFAGPRLATRAAHGTGCAFSSALACNLALGKDLPSAVAAAKHYVAVALSQARPLGRGAELIEHLIGFRADSP